MCMCGMCVGVNICVQLYLSVRVYIFIYSVIMCLVSL